MKKMNKKLINLSALLVIVGGNVLPTVVSSKTTNQSVAQAAETTLENQDKPEGEEQTAPENKPEGEKPADIQLTYKGLDRLVGYTFTTIDYKKGVEITDAEGVKYEFEVKAVKDSYEKADTYDAIYIVYDKEHKEVSRKNRVIEIKDRFEVTGIDESTKYVYGGAGIKDSVDWKKGIKAYDHALGEGEKGLIKPEQLVTDFNDWDKEVVEAPLTIYYEEIIPEPEAQTAKKMNKAKKADKKVLHKLGTKYVTLTAHKPKLEAKKTEVSLAEGNSINLSEILTVSDLADKEIAQSIQMTKNEQKLDEKNVKEGVYEVEYTATNKFGKTDSALVKYKVFAAPVCKIPDMKIVKGSQFDPKKDVNVTFKKEPNGKVEDVTADLILPKATEVDTSKKGTYDLIYKYTYNDVTWDYVRRVVVAEENDPWITAKPLTITATSDKNIDLLKKIKFTAKDYNDTDLKSKVSIKKDTNKVDFTKEGDYEVVLEVKGEKATTETTVKVKVVAQAPELELKDLSFSLGTAKEKIDLKKAIVSATDKVDGNILDKVEIEKVEIDTSKVGSTEVSYTVKNSNNKVTSKKAKVTITEKAEEVKPAKVSYSTHVQNQGWKDFVTEGLAGTEGQSLRLEGVKIQLENVEGNIEYRTHVQDTGWEDNFVANGAVSGTQGESKRLEAIEIKLSGEAAEKYDVYYRVHAQGFGWLDWAKNGEPAGTEGYAYRLEGLEIKLVPKGEKAPGKTATPFQKKEKQPVVEYSTHVQNEGWQNIVTDGKMSGTSGKALRLEGIKINVKNSDVKGGIEYATHVQNIGWQKPVINGAVSGTSGKSLRLEAIHMKLTGKLADSYDVYYRVHAQNFGWLGWAKNGAEAGTAGYGYRLEGIEIKLVKKGEKAPGSTVQPFLEKGKNKKG